MSTSDARMMMDSDETMMRAAGIGIVGGFFLPWLDLPVLGNVSGWDILHSSLVSDGTRTAIGLWLVLGVALVATASISRRATTMLSVASGAAILGFTFYWLAQFFADVIGIGLMLVLGGGAVALVCGLTERGRLSK